MAYVIAPKSDGSVLHLPYLPQCEILNPGNVQVEFDHYREQDVPQMYDMWLQILDEGQTYPQETCNNIDEFRQYYLSHDAFVVRNVTNPDSPEVLGSFYVKPNYPGRSSHICNAGFMVQPKHKGHGIGKYLVPKFLRVAHDLGYLGSIFNLVYVTNTPSIKLWENFGFKQVGRVPNAGRLKNLGYVDAIIFYYDLTTVPFLEGSLDATSELKILQNTNESVPE